MKLPWSKTAGLLAIVVLAAGTSLAGHKKDTVDGTSWTVEVHADQAAKEKGERDFNETIIFADGMMTTTKSKTMGFESTPYKATRSGEGKWDFTAEQVSKDQGRFVWTGTIHGDDAEGKLVWTKPDNSIITYTFDGDLKK
jgi:hypothetical protein